jgi:hypothetical protein
MFLKPTSSFKLSKNAKRLMAAHADPRYSNLIKRAFIQAELGSKIVVKTKKDKTDNNA